MKNEKARAYAQAEVKDNDPNVITGLPKGQLKKADSEEEEDWSNSDDEEEEIEIYEA